MECPACGYDNNEDGSQFCSQCGFPLSIEESELPDDVRLPESSWDGMERAVPYVIAGLKTGQLPSSLEDRATAVEDDPDAPRKLETVFYADYAEEPTFDEGDEAHAEDDGASGEGLLEGEEGQVGEAPRTMEPAGIDTASDDATKDLYDLLDAIEEESRVAGDESSDGAFDGVEAIDVSDDIDADGEGDSEDADVADAGGDDDDDAGDDDDAPDAGTAAEDDDDDDDDDIDLSIPIGKHARRPGTAAAAVAEASETPADSSDSSHAGQEGENAALDDNQVDPEGSSDGHERSDESMVDGGWPQEYAYPDDLEAEGGWPQEYAYPEEGAANQVPSSASSSSFSSTQSSIASGEVVSTDERSTTLQDLPAIQPVDYTRMEPSISSTAVMPVITRRDAIRYSTSDRDRLDARRKRAPNLPMLIAALLAVVAIFGGVYLVSHGSTGTTVPDVVGMSSDSARTTLLNAGFQVDVKSQLTEDNHGIVLSCDPEAGAKKRKGTHVTITVSASRTIPDVVGMDLESAQNKLADEGAQNVQVASRASNQPENTVIDIEPSAGSAFNLDDEITLTVATSATVPDVVGMRQEEAMAAITEAGYMAEVKWADSDSDAGTVVSTNPERGSHANLNSTVTVFVASPGPRDFYHIIDYFGAYASADSEYLQWKGFTVAGSYSYQDAMGVTYASQTWQQADGATVSFTPVPYAVDMGYAYDDYMAAGIGFQGVRLYIPSNSSYSLGTDVSMDGVQKYMDACGFDNLQDSCTNEDVKSEAGASGNELGLPALACAQGETNGYVWTVLVTDNATYIGCGTRECYEGMNPICDGVVLNEMYSS